MSIFAALIGHGNEGSEWFAARQLVKERRHTCLVMVKATAQFESSAMPTTEELAEMGPFNEELVKTGVMLGADGLHPSSKGAHVRFSGKTRTVLDVPFAKTKEVVAGFWLWQVSSMDKAIEWVRHCPNPMRTDSEIDIRPAFGVEDFGGSFTPERREQEEQLRRQIAQKDPDRA